MRAIRQADAPTPSDHFLYRDEVLRDIARPVATIPSSPYDVQADARPILARDRAEMIVTAVDFRGGAARFVREKALPRLANRHSGLAAIEVELRWALGIMAASRR